MKTIEEMMRDLEAAKALAAEAEQQLRQKLEADRSAIEAKLALLGGATSDPPAKRPRKTPRTGATSSIRRALADQPGLTYREVEALGFNPTLLSNMRKTKQIRAEGVNGSSRYFLTTKGERLVKREREAS